MNPEHYAAMALSSINGLGAVSCRRLVEKLGSAQAVLSCKSKKELSNIHGISEEKAQQIITFQDFKKVDQEIEFIHKNNIQLFYFFDPNYPPLLKECFDAPFLLFVRGNLNTHFQKKIAIVGTRKATIYGKNLVHNFIQELIDDTSVQIISGLAEGIDTFAHENSLRNNIHTMGVLGHGLNKIFPAKNQQLAEEIIAKNGALITEYWSHTPGMASNFPQRNRIIAGLSKAILVVESQEKGGALITAQYANNYQRDVFAFPGKIGDSCSVGCNNLIKTNQAVLIENAKDLKKAMNWHKNETAQNRNLFTVLLSKDEEKIIHFLEQKNNLAYVDDFLEELDFSMNQLNLLLLEMELKQILKSHPGNAYSTI